MAHKPLVTMSSTFGDTDHTNTTARSSQPVFLQNPFWEISASPTIMDNEEEKYEDDEGG